MAVITFMSDFGTTDHYVAAVKASIISKAVDSTIIDLTHDLQTGDIGHAAYILSHVFRDFPEGTVHICAIDRIMKKANRRIALKLEGHYFVGYDSGLFSLISKEIASEIVELEHTESTFVSKDIFGPIAVGLSQGASLGSFGQSITDIQRLIPRQLKVTKREISGNIIRVDNYGNVITNITRVEFNTILNLNNKKAYTVWFGKESCRSIHNSYSDVDSGDCFLFFNSNDNLQIGINNGNASKLIGLKLDSPILIEFEQ